MSAEEGYDPAEFEAESLPTPSAPQTHRMVDPNECNCAQWDGPHRYGKGCATEDDDPTPSAPEAHGVSPDPSPVRATQNSGETSAPEALIERLRVMAMAPLGEVEVTMLRAAADALAAALAGKAQAEEREAEWKYRYEQDTLEIDALRAERDAALAGKAQAEEALGDIRREVGLEPDDGPAIVAESVAALRAERDEALATADRATAQIEEHIDAQVNAEAKVEAVRAVYRLWNEHSDLDDDGSPLTYRTAVANLRAALDTTKEDSDGR